MYAIIKTGGKQYKVREGDTVEVELLDGEAGDTVELNQVLMVAGDGETAVGSPTVEDALVRATILDEVRGEKVVVFKYKPKNRYARKTGHRQNYTRLKIDEIVLPGMEPSEAEAEEEAPVAETPAAEVEVEEEAPVVEAPAAEVEAEEDAPVVETPAAEVEAEEEAPVVETPEAELPEPAEATAEVEAEEATEPEPTEETAAEELDETPETAGESEEETETEEE